MRHGSIPRLLLHFSLPAIVGMMTQALYNLIDSVFVGRALGDDGIAAMFVAFPPMLILMSFGMLIGFGAAALISIRLGERKIAEAENVLRNAAIMLAIASLALTFVGFLALDELLHLLKVQGMVFEYARQYMQIILAGAFFQIVGFGLNASIRAEGNPRVAMMTLLIGVLLNILLAPFFIFRAGWILPVVGWSMPGFGGGMQGAALATILAQVVSAVWVIWYFIAGGSHLKLRLHAWRPEWPVCRKILSIGSPQFVLQLAACVLQFLMIYQLQRFGGNLAVAAMGIIYRFVLMILMPLFGLNQGAQPIIGYNYGARQFDRVKKALLVAILWACAVTAVGFAVVMIFPAQVIRLFDPDNDKLVELGTHAMRVSMLMLPIVGFQVIGASYFQAVGKPKMSMLLSLSRQVLLLIPAVLILPEFFGLDGVWAALPTADACSSILTGTCLYFELRHLQKRHEEG
ncbi:MAG: MATE family efflux transporter [Pirellulales bacterium]|nr:MATE family efflux transporter [Pirellulales bacterium]